MKLLDEEITLGKTIQLVSLLTHNGTTEGNDIQEDWL